MCRKILFILTLTVSPTAFSEVDLSDRLIELRSKIQQEADQLDMERGQLNSRIQSLTVEKGELEARKNILKDQNERLSQTLIQKRGLSQGEELEDFSGYRKTAIQALQDLENYIGKGVPFKINERSQKISQTIDDLDNEKLTASEFLNEMWMIVQRELRLSESIEIQKETVAFEDQDFKTTVLRLGAVAMYYKKGKGEYGYFEKNKTNEWKPQPFKKTKNITSISNLFSLRDKGVKDGIYEIPLRLEGDKDVF